MTNPEILIHHEQRPTGPNGAIQTWRVEEQRWHDVDNEALTVIGRRVESVVNVQAQIDSLQAQIDTLNVQIADLQHQISDLQSLLPPSPAARPGP